MHAGAGSVIHAIRAGKFPVIMPRRIAYAEHVNDHQVEFAQALAAVDKVIMLENPQDLEQASNVAMTRQKKLSNYKDNRESSISPLISLIDRVLSDYADDLSVHRR